MKNTNLVESRPQAKVSFGFRSDDLEPYEVTRMIGIQPSWSCAKGERSKRMRTPQSSGIWAFDLEGANMNDVVQRVVDALDGKRLALREVEARFGASASIGIWWEPEGGQGGYTLSSKLVAELSSLAERIDF